KDGASLPCSHCVLSWFRCPSGSRASSRQREPARPLRQIGPLTTARFTLPEESPRSPLRCTTLALFSARHGLRVSASFDVAPRVPVNLRGLPGPTSCPPVASFFCPGCLCEVPPSAAARSGQKPKSGLSVLGERESVRPATGGCARAFVTTVS